MTQWPLDILPLIRRLAQEKPIHQGLLVGPQTTQDQWQGDWHAIDTAQLTTLPFAQRYDLAVVWLQDDPQTAEVLEHGLTRLRDILARKVLVLTHPTHTDRLRALGFSCIEDLNDWQFWQFNILEYKQVPDWLNAKYWANPENFGKYRW